MIDVPPEFIPSQLLTCESVSQRSRKLLEQSGHALTEQNRAEAERCALDALNASRRLGKMVDHAVALIYLADIYRSVGRLGPALEYNEKAQQMLKNQPGPLYYHNRAVADYALGLTHHMLGNDSKALDWYEHAQDLFKRANLHWGIEGDRKRQEQCTRVIRWIDVLITNIAEQGATPLDTPFFNLIWLPVFPLRGGEVGYSMAEWEVTECLVARELKIEGKPFCPYSVTGKRKTALKLKVSAKHFVLKVLEDNWNDLPAETGDYLLIRLDTQRRPGPGVVWLAENEEWAFGEFKRDATTGKIRFEPQKPYVIGADAPRGPIIAILKPIPPAP